MSQLLKVTIIVLLVGIVGALIIPYFRPDDTDKYKPLQNRIDSLLTVNDSLNKQLVVLDSTSNQLKANISNEKVKIVYIKQQGNEKIKIIDGFNGNQLYDYFANLKAYDTSIRQ